jgi:thiamine biosynthesis lipoprotein ApbE
MESRLESIEKSAKLTATLTRLDVIDKKIETKLEAIDKRMQADAEAAKKNKGDDSELATIDAKMDAMAARIQVGPRGICLYKSCCKSELALTIEKGINSFSIGN